MEKSNDHDKASHGGSGGGATEKWEETSPGIRTAETMLRLAPVGLCVAALVVMLKDSETNEFGSISYSNLTAFRYVSSPYTYINFSSSRFRVTSSCILFTIRVCVL